MYYKSKLKDIKAMLFDVDGVFSKEIFVVENGELNRTMNAKDGFSIRYATEQGFLIGIITGGNSNSVKIRFQELGITDIYMAQRHKIDAFDDFCAKYNILPENIMYMGDDLPDYEVMKKVGLAVAPADAAQEIKSIATYISAYNGGEGCVRDIVEQIMKVQKKWNAKYF